MIVDTLRSAGYYFCISGRIEAGLAFIQDAVRGALEDGEYEIDGRDVHAVISSFCPEAGEKPALESHRNYIDIHYCLEGEDVIGWRHIDDCSRGGNGYDEEKDVLFHPDVPETRVKLSENTFCVFFPHDAHAPKMGEGSCRKLVVKVAV